MSFLHPKDDPFVAARPLSQSAAFARALAELGRPPHTVTVAGVGPVHVVRRAFGPLRVGLVSRLDLPRGALRRLARDSDVGVLLLNPETASGAHGAALQTPSSVAEWDLSPSLSALRAGLKQKWRNRLSKGARAGLTIVERPLDPTNRHWLFAKEAAQARARGYANWPEALTLAFARANPGQTHLFEARLAGASVAAMLFLCHGSVATYHIGWTSDEGRGLCAHHALIWRALERFKARGVTRLDLGAVATDVAPGLARFKLGTGAQARRLGGSWVVVPGMMRGI